jgi:hypothetical protein
MAPLINFFADGLPQLNSITQLAVLLLSIVHAATNKPYHSTETLESTLGNGRKFAFSARGKNLPAAALPGSLYGSFDQPTYSPLPV